MGGLFTCLDDYTLDGLDTRFSSGSSEGSSPTPVAETTGASSADRPAAPPPSASTAVASSPVASYPGGEATVTVDRTEISHSNATTSPECEVLRHYSEELVTLITTDLLNIALKLYTHELIGRDTKDACLLDQIPQQKACRIVSAVERKVEACPSLFHKFTTLLQDEGDDCMKSLGRKLQHECSSIREIVPGPSTLFQQRTPHQSTPPPSHSPLSLYADKLRTLYAESELPRYSNPSCYKWTPSPSKKFIDLTITDRKGMTTKQVDEYKKATVYGKITEMFSASTNTLDEIVQAKPGEKLECILVEGAPGIGKSTLAWQACHRWGKRELFQQYSLVLLLPLRDKRVQEATCIEELFISSNTKLQEQVRKEVIQKDWDGRHALIILEGLDELPSHLLSSPSIFTALLSGTELHQATILVTSRPSATEQLHKNWNQRISRHFEICGFTEDNVNQYAQSVLSDQEKLSGFKEYISIHPHIQSMLYMPLHCVIATTVYLQSQLSRIPPPKTLTGLYICLTQTILTQYLNDHPELFTGGNYTLHEVFGLQIPSPIHNHFKELCRIAFENLKDQKLIFSIANELHELGFTDAVPELLLFQQPAHYSYNFLHLSVQEFLAAYYISVMRHSEQEHLFRSKLHKIFHFENIIQYVAGITKFEGLNKAIVKQAIGVREIEDRLGYLEYYHLELLYECQDMSILDTKRSYLVPLREPSPNHCLVVGYCIANSSCQWALKLKVSDRTQAEMFLQGLKQNRACDSKYSITRIEFVGHCTDFIYNLFTQNAPQTFIECIEALHIEPSRSHLEALPPCELPDLIPKMKRLKALTVVIQSTEIPDTSPFELDLISALSGVPTLRHLRLSRLDSKGTAVLCQWLPTCHLQTLCVPRSKFTSQSIQAIGSMLQLNCSLTVLDISQCIIDSESVGCLADALHSNTTLRELCMKRTLIGNNGAVLIAQALHHNTALRVLDMNKNSLEEEGALAMAEMLRHNTTLEVLNLITLKHFSNKIGDKGIKALLESLAVNQHLKKLLISLDFEKVVRSHLVCSGRLKLEF